MSIAEYKNLSAPANLAEMKARLSPAQRQAAEAMRLCMRLSAQVTNAYINNESDRRRRAMQARRRASARLERRLIICRLNPTGASLITMQQKPSARALRAVA